MGRRRGESHGKNGWRKAGKTLQAVAAFQALPQGRSGAVRDHTGYLGSRHHRRFHPAVEDLAHHPGSGDGVFGDPTHPVKEEGKTIKQKRKKPARSRFLFLILHSSGNFTGSDASCAYVLSGDSTVFFNLYRLNVSVPLSSGVTVGVGYCVTGYLTLTTNFAFSGHLLHLLLNIRGMYTSYREPVNKKVQAINYISNSDIIAQQNVDVKHFFQKVPIFFFEMGRVIIKLLAIGESVSDDRRTMDNYTTT